MGIKKIIKPGLFIYECFRIVLLVFTLVIIMRQSYSLPIPWIVITTPAVLFPVMALFLWINISRYRNYLPLYIAGKIIEITAFLGWAVMYGKLTMNLLTFEGGNFFALAAALFLTKEDTQCE